jgi:hypothetical protein
MKALCPHCNGTGTLDAKIASGTSYVRVCLSCKQWIGGCIVGGNSPLKKVPKAGPCPFCEGKTMYKRG